jgi:hypothetical protein
VEVPRQNTTSAPETRDRGSWTKFSPPAGSNRGGESGVRGRPAEPPSSGSSIGRGSERFPQQPERTQQSAPDTRGRSSESGGWQRFPSSSDRSPRMDAPVNRNDRPDNASSRPTSKPRLDFDKPIVTPRSTPAVRTEPRREPSPSASPRMPEVRNEPRYSPPPSRGPEMRGGGSAPRSTPSRSEGGGNRGGNRGGNNSGDKGSKSSGRFR